MISFKKLKKKIVKNARKADKNSLADIVVVAVNDYHDLVEFIKNNKEELVNNDIISNKLLRKSDYFVKLYQVDENMGLFNIGKNNSGDFNTGNCNSGNNNQGKYNSGFHNKGDGNSGNSNLGDNNAGDYNIGHFNTGDYNIGRNNSGRSNIGFGNTGNGNLGDYNSGNCNIGNSNSGLYNCGDYNSGICCKGVDNNGVFCTSDTKSEINIFNKPSGMTMSEFVKTEAYRILSCFGDTLPAIEHSKRQELYDKPRNRQSLYREKWKSFWKDLSASDKNTILNMPNFDEDIFCEITGLSKPLMRPLDANSFDQL